MRIDSEFVRRNRILRRLASPRLNRYIPHSPTPPQAAFLCLDQLEAFYGGAAGGGKSDAILMAALQFVDVAGYDAVIVRETYQMLAQPGGLMARAEEWLGGTDASWISGDHQWRFPSGATLTFRHLQDRGAHRSFQGSEYHFIGVDEVTDFSEDQYRFLFSRLRRGANDKLPVRMRSASNPYGPGLEWCHRRFVIEGPSHGRIFIPARLEDNPHLDVEAYELALKELGPVVYRQLRHGDWTIRPEGGLFAAASFEGRFCERDAVPSSASLVRYWDLAGTEPGGKGDPDYTAGCLLARTNDGEIYVVDVRRARLSPLKVERLVKATADKDAEWAKGRGMTPPAIRMEQEPGSAGQAVIDNYRRRVLAPFDFKGVRSTGSKETRAAPVAARVEARDVRVCRGDWNTEFLDELVAFPGGTHDDQVDALAGAYGSLSPQHRPIDFRIPYMGPARRSPWNTNWGAGSGNIGWG